MKTIIHSKWHKISDPLKNHVCLEIGDYNGLSAGESRKYVDTEILMKMFKLYDVLPKYVMYDDIVGLVFADNSPLHKSVQAMIKTDLAHLPFREMMVEYDINKEVELVSGSASSVKRMQAREFVWVGEDKNGFFPKMEAYPFFAQSMCVVDMPNQDRPMIILNSNCLVGRYLTDGAQDGTGKLGLEFRSYLSPFIKSHLMPSDMRQALLNANCGGSMHSASCAITAMVALLRTKGVVQDKIEAPAKLNKNRAASGKPLIRDHTVIRIGHLYDRQGNQVAYNSTGKKMSVHWRAGHIRNQRFGPKLSKSYDVFIEPMLINYEDGAPPVPNKEVTI